MKIEERNQNSLPEACIDPERGVFLRRKNRLYFEQLDEQRASYIMRHENRYIIVPFDEIPRHLLRYDDRAEKNTRLMCVGCGKMFHRNYLDNGLCRGYDGCSVKKEISELRIENIQRRESTNEKYRMH